MVRSKHSLMVVILLFSLGGIAAAGVVLPAGDTEHHGYMVNSEAGFRECLTCHDDVVATGISPCLAQICMLKSDHSVDKPYPPSARTGEFAPAPMAEAEGVKFVNGRIDCISCHDLRNRDQYHLRVEDRKSRLCRACHLK